MITMAAMALIQGGVQLAGALASGIANEKKQFKEIDAQKEQLTENYNQSKLELDTQYKQTKNDINYNIGYTSKLRSQNANLASQGNVKNNQFMYEDLSMMLEDVVGSQGQAVQNAAMTGFRNTEGTTQQKALSEVEEAKQYQIDRAVETLKLNSAQSFAAASENYFSATAQIEQYRNNLSNLETNYKNATQSLLNQYNQSKAELDRARDEADYKFWEVLLDIATVGVSTFGNYVSGKNADIQFNLNNELTQLQIDQYKIKPTAVGANNSTRHTQMVM